MLASHTAHFKTTFTTGGGVERLLFLAVGRGVLLASLTAHFRTTELLMLVELCFIGLECLAIF